MIVLLVTALLPITLLSILQGMVRLENRRAAVVRQLSENAGALADGNQSLLVSTESLLRIIAMNPIVAKGGPACSAALDAARDTSPALANLMRFDADGRLVCAATAPPTGYVVPDKQLWAAAAASTDIMISDAIWGKFSRRRIIRMLLPVHDDQGAFDGAMTASIDLGWLTDRLRTRVAGDQTGVAIVSDSGQVLTQSRALPAFNAKLLPGNVGRVRDRTGTVWSYTTVPLVASRPNQNGLHVVYASPEPARFGLLWWQTIVDFALPVLAILMASVAIWVGTERLVLRWLRSLQGLALQYAGGDYRRRSVSFAGAPSEIRSVAASLYRMSSAIGDRDSRLREALQEQRLLIREVHHRVKNNFQVVMSLLSLQSSRLTDENAKRAIDQTRRRISALALVHRQLYDEGELTRVSSRALLTALCEQLQPRAATGPSIDITGLADVGLDIDSAVPLTLWLVETVNNALHHGYPPPASGSVQVAFEATAENGILTVRDNGIGFDPAAAAGDASGYGLRLIKALASQLGGVASVGPTPAAACEARLEFPLEPRKLAPEPVAA